MKYFQNLFLICIAALACNQKLKSPDNTVRIDTTQNQDLMTGRITNAQFHEVDSLLKINHVESALGRLKEMKAQFGQSGDWDAYLRSVMSTCQIYANSEDGIRKVIDYLDTEIKEASSPARSILLNLQAGTYVSYLNTRRYQQDNVSETSADNTDPDIATWSLAQLQNKAQQLFIESLADSATKTIRLNDLHLITTSERPPYVISTLFDFLSARVLEYMDNPQNYLTEPVYKFTMKGAAWFMPYDKFIHINIASPDTSSSIYQGMLVYQELIRYQLEMGQDTSLFWYSNLGRLKFAYEHSVDPEKDKLYLASLDEFIFNGKGGDWKSQYMWERIALMQSTDTYDVSEQGKGDKDLLKKLKSEADKIIKLYPRTPAAAQASSFISNLQAVSVQIKGEEVQLPSKPFFLTLDYKNASACDYTIYRLTQDEFIELQKNRRDNKSTPGQIERKSSASLINPGDYRSHTAEIKVDGLNQGYYAIATDSENFKDYNYGLFQVSNLAVIGNNNNYIDSYKNFIVVDRNSGQPLKGVNADLYRMNYNSRYNLSKVKSYTTDANGMIAVSLPENQSYFGIYKQGKDELVETGNQYFSTGRDYQNRDIQYRFFLDRAIYRPGQTLYFKAIAYRLNKKNIPEIVTRKDIKISLYDVNGQEVSTLSVRSNDFGSVNGSFTIPTGLLTGDMSLYVSGSYSVGFKVEEYKRPKFESTFDTIRETYVLNDEVNVKGSVKNYAGNPVDQAVVKYTITRTERRRWYFYDYFFSRGGKMSSQSNEMIIENGTVVTDEFGNYSIKFKALPDESIDPKTDPAFNFSIETDVTDINGETQSSSKLLTISYRKVDVAYQVKSPADVADLRQMQIITKNIEGTPIEVSGTLLIEKLNAPASYLRPKKWGSPEYVQLPKTEYKSLWPHEAYLNEADISTWSVNKVVLNSKIQSGKNPIDQLENAPLSIGYYRVVFVPDGDKAPGRKQSYYVHVNSDRAKNLIEPGINNLFALTSDHPVYAPNEKAQIELIARNASGYVWLQARKQNVVLWQKWVVANRLAEEIKKIQNVDRGGIMVSAMAYGYNSMDQQSILLNIPWSNKELDVQLITFRDKLLPGQEESWDVKISGPQKEAATAEVLASMYDQSLDVFATAPYTKIGFPTEYPARVYKELNEGTFSFNIYIPHVGNTIDVLDYSIPGYRPELTDRYYAISGYRYDFRYNALPSMAPSEMIEKSMAAGGKMSNESRIDNSSDAAKSKVENREESTDQGNASEAVPVAPAIRTNLEETVFFYPDLYTDSTGAVIIRFKMKEALTRWLFRIYAHTKDLQQGYQERTVTTSKDLMIFPNLPRYFRESDELELTAKVSALNAISGPITAKLELYDAITNQPLSGALYLSAQEQTINLAAGKSGTVSWKLKSPALPIEAVAVRMTASATSHQDGEENVLPVVSNRMLVTETMPMNIRAGQTRAFNFDALQNAFNSSTMVPYNYSVEYTANPVWYAIQALPYLMEYPYECTEQILNRYYANALATYIAKSNPKIKAVFDRWRGTDALLSNLQKNQELKSALLEETPWVLEAKSEEQQKKNIALLFDLNRMANEERTAFNKILERQYSNGGFPWFPGGRENEYMTSYVLENLGHMRALGIQSIEAPQLNSMSEKAIAYCDSKVNEHYAELKKSLKGKAPGLESNYLDHWFVQYLYARSFYDAAKWPDNEAFNFYFNQLKKYWASQNVYMQGMTALVLNRNSEKVLAKTITEGLRQTAEKKEELGMYWPVQWGYYWYQLPIETQSLMIEVFDEVTADHVSVDEMKLWLLKNKETTHWKTTKATSAAIYALMKTGGAPSLETILPTISIGSKTIDLKSTKQEAGTGYFKINYPAAEIKPELANIRITNNSTVVNWGAAYWQYFEQLDKITTFKATPLTITKTYNVVRKSDRGEVLEAIGSAGVRIGDRIRVRTVIRVDRPMEYVHLKDMRPAGMEPVEQVSGYRYSHGLGYYQAPRDLANHYFIDYLPAGTYTFEYDLFASVRGDFSTGISTAQCMYAPGFSSHSKGERMVIR